MAWTPTTTNTTTNVGGYTSGAITLPSSAVLEYTPVIDFVGPRSTTTTRYIFITGVASAISGTNIDIGLYGSDSPTGTKYLLADAPIADISNAAKAKGGVIDLNAYPAPYYFLGHTADADEHANTVTYTVMFA
jgi:hypothetical protein